MSGHKIVTISETGTISYYTPPETTPHSTQQTPAPQTISNQLPLLTHHKSSILHPSTRTRFPTSPITAITALPPIIVTGNSEGFITIFYPGGNTKTYPIHVNSVTEIQICDAGENMITSGVDGFVHITRLCNPEKPALSLRHSLPVTTFVTGYSSTTARVVTASADRSTRVFHLSSTKLIATIRHDQHVTALTMGPDENFWWGGRNGAIGKIDISALPVDGVIQATHFANRDAAVGCMAHSDGAVIVGFSDGIVNMFDPVTNVLLRSFGGGAGLIGVFVQYSPDDDVCPNIEEDVFVGSGRNKRVINAWDVLNDYVGDAFDDVGAENHTDISEVQRLTEEVERLRKRNRQLEDAGNRLIELVERDR